MKQCKLHNVLGRYCWDCKKKTEVGIPGWPKSHKGSGTRYSPWVIDSAGNGVTSAIIWANGDIHRRKESNACGVCNKHCGHPVEREFLGKYDGYREVAVSSIKEG